jgi:HD-GYP domain-containing protein (c-di-GMP phosphodiesterase class II)
LGYPAGLAGEEIPLAAPIPGLAQTIEVFADESRSAAYEVAWRRRGTWFDPQLVDAFAVTGSDEAFWRSLASEGRELRARVAAMEPSDRAIEAEEHALDRASETFARVVDAKSPWTYRHSVGVAEGRSASGAGSDCRRASCASFDGPRCSTTSASSGSRT